MGIYDDLRQHDRRTVAVALAEGVRRYRDRPYLTVVEGDTYTFREIDALSSAIRTALEEQGVKAADHVAFMLPNGAQLVATFFALMKLGAVAIPIGYTLVGEPLRHILEHSGAVALVTDPDSVRRLGQAGLHGVRPIVIDPEWRIGATSLVGTSASTRWTPSRTWVDPAAIVYTGGTTGFSKGVVISHSYALCEGGLNRPQARRLGSDDVYFCCLPLHHGILFITTLLPWLSGARLVIAPRFSASTFWKQVRQHGATVTMLVGPMIPYLFQQPPSADDRSNPLRQVWGNPMPQLLYREFEQRFDVELLESYAMTEASPITLTLPGQGRPGSCGKPVDDIYQVEIVDERDEIVPRGEVGEIVVRPLQPHTMMEGYYRAPEDTLRQLRNLWFHTGDLGYRDDDGYFYVVGRLKDSIRSRGENVSAREVEAVLGRVPGVKDVAVVPVAAGSGDEEIKAVVEISESFDVAQLRAVIAEELPKYMRPRYLRITDALPRTELGRVRKTELSRRDDADIDLSERP